VNKFSINLIVAIAAFLFGLASASAFGEARAHGEFTATLNSMMDTMGNIYAAQEY
jgi:hypothetical protein